MPAKKKMGKKITSARPGRKPSAAGTKTRAKKRTIQGEATRSRSTTKSRKTGIGATSTTVLESQPSSRAKQILVTATKMALVTRRRAKRLVQRAGEFLSKPGQQVQHAIAMAGDIPDKVKNYRNRSKTKKEEA